MRTISPSEELILKGRRYGCFLKVEIKDAGGSWIDYSDYVNFDMQDRCEITKDADQRVAQATVELIRETSGNSLAPLLNADIDIGRGIRIAGARVARGASPGSADWKPLFEGEIDEWGHPEVSGTTDTNRLVLVARDNLGRWADRWVEEATEYGAEDGVPLEDVMQTILDDWGGEDELYVPSATGTDAGPYRQEETPVLDAVQVLADLIGHVIEDRYHEGTSSWRRTLREPDRSPSATQWSFGPSDYFAVNQLKVARYFIRNVVIVRYTDATTGQRTSVSVIDDASVAKYGRRVMILEEGDDSPINSQARAEAMADAALSDLANPIADQEITGPFFWPIELDDFYEFKANGVHYDVDQKFGVTGYTHVFERGEAKTRIRTRGTPAGTVRGWHRRERRPRPPEETEAGLALLNFREISRTATEITYGWTLGSDLAEAWIHDYQEPQPYSEDKWPAVTRIPDTIVTDRDATYTVAIPEQGFVGYLQVEGRRVDGSLGQMERVLIFPSNIAGDFIAFASCTVNQADGSVKITGWTTDRAKSVAYAYNVGAAASVAPPSMADAEAQGGSADDGGLVTGFTSDFEITLEAGTVGFGEVIKGLLIAYINEDGTGPDGSAQNHDTPVGFQGERFKITDSDQIDDGVVISRKLREGAQNVAFPASMFSASDWNTVAWSAQTLTTAGGATYSIAAGNTGNIPDNNPRYIYLDPAVSSTVLQVSTAYTDALDDDKILMAVAWRAPHSDGEAGWVPVAGMLGINGTVIGDESIETAMIRALAITTGLLNAGAVTAAKINVASLSAISADLGTVTAGTVSANVIVASESFTAPNPVFAGSITVEDGEEAARVFLGATGGGLVNLFDEDDALAASLFAFEPGKASLIAAEELWLGSGEKVFLKGFEVSLGANDSGGSGKRLVLVDNA